MITRLSVDGERHYPYTSLVQESYRPTEWDAGYDVACGSGKGVGVAHGTWMAVDNGFCTGYGNGYWENFGNADGGDGGSLARDLNIRS